MAGAETLTDLLSEEGWAQRSVVFERAHLH